MSSSIISGTGPLCKSASEYQTVRGEAAPSTKGIRQGSDSVDRRFDPIALLQPARRVHEHPDPAGSAGRNDISRFEREGRADVLDQEGDVEDQVIRIRFLP